ncbi:MAG: serine hydrolase [Lactobacillus sp.]|nr:class A beta-lactamase-related serine hydrolase [Lactobacillus sp.]MDN6052770.1 class A beta-lactamase-related serine hydrolase [Lactobacillus sp.]
MKNKLFIASAIATFFAFMLYSANLKRISSGQLPKIITQTTRQQISAHASNKTHEPKLSKVTPPLAHDLVAAKGSNAALVKVIKPHLTSTVAQVAVNRIAKPRLFARVANQQQPQRVGRTIQLFLLATLFTQEAKGKLGATTSITIKRADRVKGDAAVRLHIAYGIQYLRATMLQGSGTAANALLRKVGIKRVNLLAHQLGAKQTRISDGNHGLTTASDLARAFTALSTNKIAVATQVLANLQAQQRSLAWLANASNKQLGLADHRAGVALMAARHKRYVFAFVGATPPAEKLLPAVNHWLQQN